MLLILCVNKMNLYSFYKYVIIIIICILSSFKLYVTYVTMSTGHLLNFTNGGCISQVQYLPMYNMCVCDTSIFLD
jgi:hypothetical protein